MKYCDDYAATLDLFVDGELTPAEMADVQAHLDTCPGCRAYVDDAMALRAAFPDVEETVVPEGFADSVMAAVAASAPAAKKPVRKNLWLKTLMPLAACLAVVIVLRNGPVTGGSGGWGMGASKATATPSASAAPAAAEAAPEAPAAAAPREINEAVTADTAAGNSAYQSAAPTAPLTEDRKAKMENDVSFSYMAAHAVRMEIPSEAARFLEGFSPVEETETERHYHLTEDEASTLQGQLGHAGIAYIAEEGIDANVDTVLVVLKK